MKEIDWKAAFRRWWVNGRMVRVTTSVAALAAVGLMVVTSPEQTDPVKQVWTVADVDRAVQADLLKCDTDLAGMSAAEGTDSYSTPGMADAQKEMCYGAVPFRIKHHLVRDDISIVLDDGSYVSYLRFESFIGQRVEVYKDQR
jgi:hypothetical protein